MNDNGIHPLAEELCKSTELRKSISISILIWLNSRVDSFTESQDTSIKSLCEHLGIEKPKDMTLEDKIRNATDNSDGYPTTQLLASVARQHFREGGK